MRFWLYSILITLSTFQSHALEPLFLGAVAEEIRDAQHSPDGSIYVATPTRILKRTNDGFWTTVAGPKSVIERKRGTTSFQYTLSPAAITFTGDGALYAISQPHASGALVLELAPNGSLQIIAGNRNTYREWDPQQRTNVSAVPPDGTDLSDNALPIQFTNPDAFTADRKKNLYFFGFGNVIYRLTNDGIISRHAGSIGDATYSNGINARDLPLREIRRLWFSEDGNLQIADGNDQYISSVFSIQPDRTVQRRAVKLISRSLFELDPAGLVYQELSASSDNSAFAVNYLLRQDDGATQPLFQLPQEYFPNIDRSYYDLARSSVVTTFYSYNEKNDELLVATRSDSRELVEFSQLWLVKNVKRELLNPVHDWQNH